MSNIHSHNGDETLPRPAHALTSDDVVRRFQSDYASGLSQDEAVTRLARFGRNEFGQEKKINPLQILIAQVFNVMVLVLILAVAASFAIKAWIEGAVLLTLILIDVVIGFFRDLQAAKIIVSLKSLQSPNAVVLRDGKYETIEATTVVPGDIIELKPGARVPADARLIDAIALETDEALLTGESLPVRKDPHVLLEYETSPGDRLNIVFTSTTVTKGRGHAVVFATGSLTEIGSIAAALKGQKESDKRSNSEGGGNGKLSIATRFKTTLLRLGGYVGKFLGLSSGTPLERKLSKLYLYIFGISIICAIIVLAANNFDGRSDVIMYAIATAVGSLPATLVLVLTTTMAAGTRVMMHKNVAVRNMRSLEALGGVTNICSDKTGTLTQGKMVARSAWLPNHGTYTVRSIDPYSPDDADIQFFEGHPGGPVSEVPSKQASDFRLDQSSESVLHSYLAIASLANHATIQKVNDTPSTSGESTWQAQGDPTEIAIYVFACRFGMDGNQTPYQAEWTRIAEFPFDSAIKRMSVLCRNRQSGDVCLFTKGAVERVIQKCSFVSGWHDKPCEMMQATNTVILEKMKDFAEQGLRVLALASRPVTAASNAEVDFHTLQRGDLEQDLIFRGLIGIYDPPRQGSKPSVLKCHQAGIQVHMLTGDHIDTARTIAVEVGFLPKRMMSPSPDVVKTCVMAAPEFDKLSDEQIDALPEMPIVIARCTPTTKVRMIDSLHRRHRHVAMTGDGVNYSPSLQRADIGIAMGLNGSDVAKSASDIILRDDNFASILNAIEEGRRIFDNIQKFMLHVLAANIGFVITLLVGLAFKSEDGTSVFQLSPVEILFMLLVAGAFTENGLGFEAASPDILRRPPQNLKHGVLTPEFYADLIVYGILITICLLCAFVIVLFGFYGGKIGIDCNIRFSESCDPVFRVRSTCFTVMMWVFLLFAWELVDNRRSFFYGILANPKAWRKRLTNNKPLFWTVIVGVAVFPTLYIPGLNHDAFLHQAIDKEWGIVFAMTATFGIGCEIWKWQKRIYLRRHRLMTESTLRRREDGNDVEKQTVHLP